MNRGLGRGLSALIPGAPAPVPASGMGHPVLVVPPEHIHPNPRQPRHEFPAEDLAELASSLRTHGVLQPLVVTVRADGQYELVAGERRLRAAKLAGLTTVPVIVRDGEHSERMKLELALIENVQRKDLNPIDRARAYEDLQRDFGLTQEEVAMRVGIARSSVAHALRLLVLPSDMQQAVRVGAISEGHAKLLASIEDPAEQRAWFDRIQQQKLSVAALATATAPTATAAPRRGRPGAAPVDPNLHAKELAIQQKLGAKVRIAPKGHGGVITIEYYSAEELAGIVRTITR